MSNKIVQQPSVMSAQARFSQVPSADTERSRFDRSHSYKTTFDGGRLIPILIDEVVPGDTFKLNTTSFCRLATPLHPIMDNLMLDFFAFFVPNRLLWSNWQRFMGEREDPDDDIGDLVLPVTAINHTTMQPDDLACYFGLPPRPGSDATAVEHSALHFRAYSLIWNEWFRDENLQDRTPFSRGDGPDTGYDGMKPLRRGKRKDYFTSALPWPQKGDPVLVPLAGTAPVTFNDPFFIAVGTNFANNFGNFQGGINEVTAPVTQDLGSLRVNNAFGDVLMSEHLSASPSGYENAAMWGSVPPTVFQNVFADLSQVSAFSVNDLRTAFQIQKLLERDARGGTRYIELVFSHFNVRSDDARMQRPELLATSSSRVSISPVASTVAGTAPQGNLAAVGTQTGNLRFERSFTEHGVIMVLCSLRADLNYQQGVEKFWSRRTRLDFLWPSFAHLGEQAIENREIYLTGDLEVDEDVFGYQERYAEYRYKPSRITGLFNSGFASSLDVWHLAQEFADLPTLSSEFIEDDPPIDRVIAVPSEPHMLADFWHQLSCERPLPVYSVPGLIDHF